MAKILIIFGSTTGNTESVADSIFETLDAKGHEVTLKNVVDAKVGELTGENDLVLLGSSTWGEDEKELQEDFIPFYEAMDSIDLSNRKLGIFGCGDSSYKFFCGGIDLLEERIEETGGKLVIESLRIDGDPGDVQDEIDDWAAGISDAA